MQVSPPLDAGFKHPPILRFAWGLLIVLLGRLSIGLRPFLTSLVNGPLQDVTTGVNRVVRAYRRIQLGMISPVAVYMD